MGAPLRAPPPDPLGRRPAALLARRPRARAPHATAPRRRAGRRRGGRARAYRRGRRGSRPAALRPAAVRDELADALDRVRRAAGAGDPRPTARRGDRRHAAERGRPAVPAASSASAGSAATPRSHRSTSPPACCAGGCSGWPAAGASGSARRRCSPACRRAARPRPDRVRLALRSRGWRIVYLGPDAPIETVEEASRQLHPSLVVLTAVSSERVQPVVGQLRGLAGRHRLALGGGAAGERRVGGRRVLRLTGDLIAEAALVTALARGARRDDRTGLLPPPPSR